MEEREWEVMYEYNWVELEGAEFKTKYMNLHLLSSKRGLHLRPKRATINPSFTKMLPPLQSGKKNSNSNGDKTKARWTNEDLKDAIGALDYGYNMKDVCQVFNIPKFSLGNHYEERERRKTI